MGGIWGRLTGRAIVQETPVIVGEVSGRAYTAEQITNLFKGNSNDIYKFIYRGMTGSEGGSGALFLADEAAYAATYAKNGYSVATFQIPAQNFQYMVSEGFIRTQMGMHGTTKGLEYVISNPVVKEAILKVARIK